MHPMLNTAVKAARRAGSIINRAALNREGLEVRSKHRNDFVTQVDQAAEDAILSIIRQAYDNFYFRKSTGEILKLINLFYDDYENFKKRFMDLGESLDKTKDKYLEISDKSFKRLDSKIQKLEDFRKGQEKPAVIEELIHG